MRLLTRMGFLGLTLIGILSARGENLRTKWLIAYSEEDAIEFFTTSGYYSEKEAKENLVELRKITDNNRSYKLFKISLKVERVA